VDHGRNGRVQQPQLAGRAMMRFGIGASEIYLLSEPEGVLAGAGRGRGRGRTRHARMPAWTLPQRPTTAGLGRTGIGWKAPRDRFAACSGAAGIRGHDAGRRWLPLHCTGEFGVSAPHPPARRGSAHRSWSPRWSGACAA